MYMYACMRIYAYIYAYNRIYIYIDYSRQFCRAVSNSWPYHKLSCDIPCSSLSFPLTSLLARPLVDPSWMTSPLSLVKSPFQLIRSMDWLEGIFTQIYRTPPPQLMVKTMVSGIFPSTNPFAGSSLPRDSQKPWSRPPRDVGILHMSGIEGRSIVWKNQGLHRNSGMDRPAVTQIYGSVWITCVLLWIGARDRPGHPSHVDSGWIPLKMEWSFKMAKSNEPTFLTIAHIGIDHQHGDYN